MSELRIETFTMPAGRLGPENPLPPLLCPRQVNAPTEIDPNIPEADRKHIGYGFDVGCLPHRMQDDYDRNRQPRDFKVAVLENENLRAMFLLELGGRMWSLIHKSTGRELLERNPVFQPANLAIRNAWFSGGVEWNIGTPGHTAYTCSPLFAARVAADNGEPVLRLYEWDRTRLTPYQMDFYLPDGSKVLFARMRIINPNDQVVPMWWWSNIAVPERPNVRVLVPAEWCYRFGYQGKLMRLPVPIQEGIDASYATNLPSAHDFFYRIPDGQRPWIAALDGEGRGIVQTSTPMLTGRKLFVWGMGPGGRRWQEFLSVSGSSYIEIQAGLARTQREHLPMPPGAEWSWLEVYAPMEADPKVVHGRDWKAACSAVNARLYEMLQKGALQAELSRSAPTANRAPEEVLHRGSGWGALERRRRDKAGQPPMCGPAMPFGDESLGEDQHPWLNLLDKGDIPYRKPHDPPGTYMIQTDWLQLLEKAIYKGHGDHWLTWLHLGVMHVGEGKPQKARKAWERSLHLQPSAWAYRNFAVLAKNEKRHEGAIDMWRKAWGEMPHLPQLVIEYGQELLVAGHLTELAELVASLPADLAKHGRIRLLVAHAALNDNRLDEAEQILREVELADVREGEVILSDLWFGIQEKRLAAREGVPINDALKQRVRKDFAPPSWLDFRPSARKT
jgi:tetratricopeptide (TPR) repeat protein